MQAGVDPVYNPDDYQRGYSREQIVAHLDEALSIFHELDASQGIPKEIAPAVFGVAQMMCGAVEKVGAETAKKLGIVGAV